MTAALLLCPFPHLCWVFQSPFCFALDFLSQKTIKLSNRTGFPTSTPTAGQKGLFLCCSVLVLLGNLPQPVQDPSSQSTVCTSACVFGSKHVLVCLYLCVCVCVCVFVLALGNRTVYYCSCSVPVTPPRYPCTASLPLNNCMLYTADQLGHIYVRTALCVCVSVSISVDSLK